ncbi:hypothetical protein AXW84_09570 [Hymenobacter sp. PAMC 26628]|nr:hypothetical protein AXW84_09570 [Hymenobacter sp. PAMC 26628]
MRYSPTEGELFYLRFLDYNFNQDEMLHSAGNQGYLFSESAVFLNNYVIQLVLGSSAGKQANLVQKICSAIKVL